MKYVTGSKDELMRLSELADIASGVRDVPFVAIGKQSEAPPPVQTLGVVEQIGEEWAYSVADEKLVSEIAAREKIAVKQIEISTEVLKAEREADISEVIKR